MEAKILPKETNGFDRFANKQLVNTMNLVVNAKFGPRNLATVKFFTNRNKYVQASYCEFYLNAQNEHRASTGTARGVNIHLQSASLADAFVRAGIILDSPLAGRGEMKMTVALRSLARACGHNGKTLVIRN